MKLEKIAKRAHKMAIALEHVPFKKYKKDAWYEVWDAGEGLFVIKDYRTKGVFFQSAENEDDAIKIIKASCFPPLPKPNKGVK
jgi:hypothetical protein